MDIPEISNAELALGTTKALPKYEDIPKEFKNWNNPTKWNKLFSDMFYNGLEFLRVDPREGVDPEKAVRVIRSHMVTWEPKHEHKEAGVAYLMSQYFKDAIWKAKEKK